jgi:hypothetical protein
VLTETELNALAAKLMKAELLGNEEQVPEFFFILAKHQIGKSDNIYCGRTKYIACVSKLNKLSEEYLSPQKTQRAAVFFIRKILGGRMI